LSARSQCDETPLSTDDFPSRVLVATVHGKPYYKIISALKSLGLPFDSVSPEEAALIDSQLVITTEQERSLVGKKNMLLDSELDEEPALIRAKILRRSMGIHQDDQLVIGIDPGNRIGVAVFYLNKEIESQVLTSVRKSVDLVSVLIRGTMSRKKIVRIGYGDPVMARQIANKLHEKFSDSITIEFVDEHGTSSIRASDVNRRGIRDKLSARVIALRKGKPFRRVLSIRN
jgi:RNase H-fold protein (predicted Holliday junction resolvase)